MAPPCRSIFFNIIFSFVDFYISVNVYWRLYCETTYVCFDVPQALCINEVTTNRTQDSCGAHYSTSWCKYLVIDWCWREEPLQLTQLILMPIDINEDMSPQMELRCLGYSEYSATTETWRQTCQILPSTMCLMMVHAFCSRNEVQIKGMCICIEQPGLLRYIDKILVENQI